MAKEIDSVKFMTKPSFVQTLQGNTLEFKKITGAESKKIHDEEEKKILLKAAAYSRYILNHSHIPS